MPVSPITSALRVTGAFAAALAVASIAIVALPQAAMAAPTTFSVTDLGDGGGGNTLRGAIALANANDGADTISIDVPGTITVSTSTITITEGLYIYGFSTAVGNKITRDFNGDIFTVAIGAGEPAGERDVTTLDLNMDGNTPATTGRAFAVTNVAPARNIGFYNSYFSGFKGSVNGGAVSVSGITGGFTADNTDFFNNAATNFGGSIYLVGVVGAIQFSSMTMQATQAVTGGGIYIDAPGSTNTLIDSEISSSTATADAGGGIFIEQAASLNVQNSTLTSNTALNAGGAIYAQSVGSTTVSDSSIFQNSSTGNRGGGLAVGSGTLTVTSSTISFNTSAIAGGGIYAVGTWVRIDNSSIHDNTSPAGGGIALGALTDASYISNSRIYDNDARSDAGAGGLGGALAFTSATGAPFAITATTFENNEAVLLTGNNPTNAGRGGAIYAVGTADRFIVEDSLFLDNSLGSYASYGVSIYVDATEVADLFNIVNTTFDESADSTAVYVHGFATAAAEFVVAHTTFVADFAIAILDASSAGPAPRVNHTIFDGGAAYQTVLVGAGPAVAVDWSLFSSTLALQDITATNTRFEVPSMKLGALQNNGGPTLTRMPQPGSPAIDTGNPAAVLLPAYDQREAGFDRVINNIVDIGAIEAPHTLAPTGATINPIIPIGGGILLLLGIGALIVANRRKRTKSH